ncbi:MAG TPA: RsmD family RNA methyltransferase [Candidatus Saccharimonadales bacterium]|nr:RsmD family RNA methyltransferase [Candidatus Saccharimonadales bacterium]
MRIVGGSLSGLAFKSPKNDSTHPMSERMRGALFNTLGDISGLSVLDPFAGSAALSFEAASRGADPVVAIEKNKKAQDAIESSIDELNLKNIVRLVRASLEAWLVTDIKSRFNIILVDPPFDNLHAELLKKLVERIRAQGLLILSCPGKSEPPRLDGLEIIKNQKYGDAQLVFYRRIT